MSDNLAVVGQHLNDFKSVFYLLAGLGSEYDMFVTSVTTRLDPLSLDELYEHLLAHEMRIEHHPSFNKPTLPSTHFSGRAPVPRGRGYHGRGFSFAPIPHDLALLDGSNTICNDSRKSASYICAITLKGLVNLKLL
jgi:hypothetical protein